MSSETTDRSKEPPRGKGSWDEIVGIAKQPGQPVRTLEDIKKAIEDGWAGIR